MMPSGWQWIILLLIVLLLFGATRLPKLARSLGESAQIFKSEVRRNRDAESESGNESQAEDGATSSESPAVEGQVIDPTADAHKSRERRDRA